MDCKTRDTIRRIANKIIEVYEISTPIKNIKNVVHAMGGKVEVDKSLPAYHYGKLNKAIYTDVNFTIIVPSSIKIDRLNFIVAYQLGHLFLHMGYEINSDLLNYQEVSRYCKEKYFKRREQATEFAKGLLMPE